jgi:hypothetical protein
MSWQFVKDLELLRKMFDRTSYLTTALKTTRVRQQAASRVNKPDTLLEVERKFEPTPASITRLRKNNGHPAFTSHVYLGRKVLKDVYLEHDDMEESSFTEKGMYIRVRNGVLEAKDRQGGDWTNSASREIVGKRKVRKLLTNTFPKKSIELEELSPRCWMRTLRDEWRIDGFNVAIDYTLFGAWIWGKVTYPQKPYIVGEVELCEEKRSSMAGEKMDRRIEAFMGDHEWAFPKSKEKVEGKLVGFDKWLKAHINKRMEATEDKELTLEELLRQ